jgi:hypothetical protein
MNQKRIRILFLFSMMITLMIFLGGKDIFAENIDPYDDGSQYAYGENVGWFNAEPLGDGGPGVEVEDSKLPGYIWAENIGWVSLSCENTSSCGTVDYGVTNDGSGNLAGYAWGENVGWISFVCDNTGSCGTVDYGVAIDPATGDFSGLAWGENIGWITIASGRPVPFGVTTSWPEDLCEGDFEPDGDVDGSDLAVFAADFGRTDCSPSNRCSGDFDSDGDVDGSDLSVFAADFGRTDCP